VEHIISPAQEALIPLDGNAVGYPTRKILIVRQEGRAMKHEGNRSTNRCIKGYRKSFVGSTWHITRGESLASSKEEEGDKRDMSLTGDNMI
jgi:hypothetical protein